MHRLWLGGIYEWAGEYRSVNIAKGEFMFAAAAQVPRLMQQFERGPLCQYTPCRVISAEEQAEAIAIVHAEFVLVHPFREGNGRCGRAGRDSWPKALCSSTNSTSRSANSVPGRSGSGCARNVTSSDWCAVTVPG